MSTHWYLVHSKPRQELIALQNLEQQGFSCYMPLIKVEKLRRNKLTQVQEPLFPRYLFIQLGKGIYDKSWTPIRSTTGVCNLVRFGIEPAKVDENLIAALRQHETGQGAHTQSLFSPGERLQITSGAFAGLDVIYQMTDGNNRVMVLIELLSKPVKMFLEPGELRKT